jgi:phenolic acid decarboxylase
MSTQTSNEPANNPLVGKTVVITYETGAPGYSAEINFFSNHQKTSTGRGATVGYVSTDNYEMVVVAPNIYMVSWLAQKDGHVVTVVWNFNDMKAYGTYSNPEPTRVTMTGVINEIRDTHTEEHPNAS